MSETQDGRDTMPLDMRVRDELVVDIPDDAELLAAIGGTVKIVRKSWKLKTTDALEVREPTEKVFTYLLAAYAANIVSDGQRPPTVTRTELIDVFGSEISDEIAWHGWVRTYDGYAEIKPKMLTH